MGRKIINLINTVKQEMLVAIIFSIFENITLAKI